MLPVQRTLLLGKKPWTPASIPGLKMWLDASRIAGLADGGSVAQWNDLSGNSNHALQADQTKRPLLKLGIQNGRPVVRFDGSNDFLQTAPFAAALAQPTTVFAVVRANGTAQAALDGISATNRNVLYVTAGNVWTMYAGTSVSGPLRDGNMRIIGAPFNGASSQILRDGSAWATGAVSAIALTGATIGAFYDGTAVLNGDIAEILVYNAALTTSQRRQVERYLAAKWGVSLVRQVVDDTFTRPDSATSMGNAETGQAWQALAGTFGISGGQAYCAVPGAGNNAMAVVDTGVSDCTLQVTLAALGISESNRMGFRFSDVNNGFILENVSNNSYTLYKRQAGTYNQVGTFAATPANGDVLRVVLSGSGITVYLNGVFKVTITDTFNQNATKHGLGTYNSTTAKFDNFTVEV